MVKYIIEGNLLFSEELNNELSLKEENIESNVCLISNLPLDDTNVKLECGHFFNYIPLYKDIKNHKQKFNIMESGIAILKNEQIRCPYCRHIQNSLLPYIELPGVEKIHGINWIDKEYYKYNKYFIGECNYKSINSNFNETIEENSIYNPKFICCSKTYVIKLKENGLDYCDIHKNIILKQINDEKVNLEKIKIKEEKLKAKLLEKENKLKAKLLEKENKLKIKLSNTQLKNSISEENLNVIKENNLFCSAILKSGLNKGNKCSNKIFNDGKCKRHFNVNNIIK